MSAGQVTSLSCTPPTHAQYPTNMQGTMKKRGKLAVFLSHLNHSFETLHVLAFRRVPGKQIEMRSGHNFKESGIGKVLKEKKDSRT